MNIRTFEITGMQFYYYHLCKRKLFMFSKGIHFEDFHDNVHLGSIIEDNYYSSKNKGYNFQGINIDMLDNQMIVHEIKKSSKCKNIDEWQVKYYLYILKKQCDVDIPYGIIHYPTENKTNKIILDPTSIQQIETICSDIKKILEATIPPAINNKTCKSCAYYDFCYI